MISVLGSARARMAVMWAALVVLAAALLLVVMNFVVARSLADETVTGELLTVRRIGGALVLEEAELTVVDEFERQVNDRTLANLRRVSLVAVVALFPMAVAIGWVVAGQVLGPVDRITRVARDIQASDLTRRIRMDGPEDELKRMGDTFDQMLDRISDSIGEQRSFVQNASHELRTPLAVATTNLDVALAADDDDALRSRAVIARRALGRLRRLVDDLFLFARQQGRDVAAEPIDVDRLVTATIEDYTEPAAQRSLTLRRGGGPAGVVAADREAVTRALANFVDNAVRLAPPGSVVTIGAGAEGRWVWLGVSDQGPGIAEADQPLVWTRFWRSSDGGTGLGLAIARQTAEAHSGRVGLTSVLGSGSSFVIWLPRDADTVDPAPTTDPLWPDA